MNATNFAPMLRLLLFPGLLLSIALHAQQLDSTSLPSERVSSSIIDPTQQLDSVQRSFYLHADSLKSTYKQKLDVLHASENSMTTKIDSLNNLHLPTEKYTEQLDSIRQRSTDTALELNKKLTDLKTKSTSCIQKLNLPPDVQEKAAATANKIQGFQLPVKDLNIPNVTIPDSPFKNLDGFNTTVKSPVGEIGNLPNVPGVGNLPKVPGIGNVGEQLGGYGKDIQNITSGNLGDAKQLSQTAETKVADVAGLGNLPKADDALGNMMKTPMTPGDLQGQGQQQIQQAVNHFAGKEQQLQDAMAQMAKLKRKYSSLNSLSDIPKRRPNEMKGKPFIERLIPGLAMQFQGKGEYVLVDLNPYAGYRLTGRLTTGLGWNHRVAYNKKYDAFSSVPRVFGPRAYGEFKIGKGFSPRAEIEWMNTLVPAVIQKITSDYKERQWVFGAFVGIKKEYHVFKNIRGTSIIMTRLSNAHHKSPYADVINVRVGFEFPMKKKVKKSAEQSSK